MRERENSISLNETPGNVGKKKPMEWEEMGDFLLTFPGTDGILKTLRGISARQSR